MKKILLSMALVLLGLNAAMAQSSLIATLSHEGNVSLFYGYNAFVDAMAAADHGDVITLSSGEFASTTITKAVTIRGAAMSDDPIKGISKTELKGYVYIEIPNETNGQSLTMEYLCCNQRIENKSILQSPKFQHLKIPEFEVEGYNKYMRNAIFIDIDASGLLSFYHGNTPSHSSLTIINSIIKKIDYNFSACECNIINSVIMIPYSGVTYEVSYINFKNCIFPKPERVLNGTNTCDHCLAIVEDGNSNILENMAGTNWTVSSMSDIFYDLDYYRLTPTAAQTYLGTDGSQVGIWGGPMPWQTTAENPTITRCQVANRSTPDGKLSVEIDVAGIQ